MNTIYCLRMPGQLVQAIDAHEAAHFSKPSKLFDRIVKTLPSEGEVELLYVMASSQDKTISIIHRVNGVEACKSLPIHEKGSLGNLLFLHCMTTLPVWMALSGQIDFDYIYFFAQKLAAQIDINDITTLPQYVQRITPEMVAQYQDDCDFTMFRFVSVGESRDPEYTVGMRACVRYVARSVSQDLNTNFNEIYPVLQYGPYITFNSYVPHWAQIFGPVDNENILPIAEDLELYAKDSVTVVNQERLTYHALYGLQQKPDVPLMTTL